MTPIPHTGLPQGTLDLLILKTLGLEPWHWWAISKRLAQISGAALTHPARVYLSWPSSPGASRMDQGVVLFLGKQSSRKVLRADEARPCPPGGREQRLAQIERCRRASPGKRVAEAAMFTDLTHSVRCKNSIRLTPHARIRVTSPPKRSRRFTFIGCVPDHGSIAGRPFGGARSKLRCARWSLVQTALSSAIT
jgi:hypothetical protein